MFIGGDMDESMTATMKDQTVVVTGATSGIGFESAKAMAQRGARVIITARDATKAAATVAALQATGNDRIEAVMIDFASMSSIRAGAADILRRTPHIHVLLNNAGALYTERQQSQDGLELTFAVNHIGYFLLTTLLLDAIKQSAPARIVNVSSDLHKRPRGIAFDDLDRKQSYSGFGVYGETKLMNVLFTHELSRRLQGSGVTTNSLHPGVIASGFGQNNKGLVGFATRTLSKYFLSTPAQGAATSVYLCTSPEVAGVSGRYFTRSKQANTTRYGEDDDAAKRLWALSEQTVCLSASNSASTR
jgi:retinol dehydrogenase 12